MVLDPYQNSIEQINSVWEALQYEQPTGFVQVYRLPGKWDPYESIDFIADDHHIFFCAEKWSTVGFGPDSKSEELEIEPPIVVLFAKGRGDTPAEVISSGREASEILVGLINVLLGNGYPMLTKVYQAVFRKDNPETIKYYPARSRVGWRGVTKGEVMEVLKCLNTGVLDDIP